MDDFDDITESELENLSPSAQRRSNGSWQALLLADTGRRWVCGDEHPTKDEALSCADELLAMINGEV